MIYVSHLRPESFRGTSGVHDAERQEELAFGCELPDGVVAIIRAKDRTIGADRNTAGAGRERVFAPRAQKVALLIVYDDRMVPAVNEYTRSSPSTATPATSRCA